MSIRVIAYWLYSDVMTTELFKTVQTTIASAPTGDLVVGKKCAGAEVYVDGVYRGLLRGEVLDALLHDPN